MAKFDQKWLEGLVFHYAEKNMIEKNGRKTLQAFPKTRPLKEEDIPIIEVGPRKGERNWTDYGDTVVIATNDGRKYTVKKKDQGAKIKEQG